jgi:hypothetical protein
MSRRGVDERCVRAVTCGLIALLLSACERNREFYYSSPDGKAHLLVKTGLRRGPQEGWPNAVYLFGAAPDVADSLGDPRPKQVRVGHFDGRWTWGAIAWVDRTTVNICPLADARNIPASVELLVAEGNRKVRRPYRITTDCDWKPRAPDVPQVSPAPTSAGT